MAHMLSYGLEDLSLASHIALHAERRNLIENMADYMMNKHLAPRLLPKLTNTWLPAATTIHLNWIFRTPR